MPQSKFARITNLLRKCYFTATAAFCPFRACCGGVSAVSRRPFRVGRGRRREAGGGVVGGG